MLALLKAFLQPSPPPHNQSNKKGSKKGRREGKTKPAQYSRKIFTFFKESILFFLKIQFSLSSNNLKTVMIIPFWSQTPIVPFYGIYFPSVITVISLYLK